MFACYASTRVRVPVDAPLLDVGTGSLSSLTAHETSRAQDVSATRHG